MIIVDPRQGSRALAAPLRRARLPVEVAQLQFGDVAFIGRGEQGVPIHVGIEFKQQSEAWQSMRTGRLTGHQIPGMVGVYDVEWLLIERSSSHHRQTDLTPSEVTEFRKRLFTLTQCAGIHIATTESRQETLRWIVDVYHWWTDCNLEQHGSHLTVWQPQTLIPVSEKRRAFMAWPRIGRIASLGVEQTFGSIRRAANGTLTEWANVKAGEKRLGESAAAQIVTFLNETQ